MPKSRLTRGLRDQIAVELRGDIIAGRFLPGVQMVERQLAQRFGVSHAPIREALLLLAHEGLLVSQTNRGAQVAPALPAALRRFFMGIRTSLEGYALRLAFADLAPSDLASWETIVRQMDAARGQHDAAALAEQDFAFHQAIVCRSGQQDVVAAWRTMIARARLYSDEWLAASHDGDGQASDHYAVLGHCRAGNVDLAVEALERNVLAEMASIPEFAMPVG